ncbi:MAG TPA: hypothetical protein RMG48_22195 [Myxococcales bacterium LLY-WYZ-16_1]|nr:hypothetical protein [Myxococcales bacterium LLY-WYZ-16_1]
MFRRPSLGDVFVAGAAWVFLVAFRVTDGTEVWLYGLFFWFLMLPFPHEREPRGGGWLSLPEDRTPDDASPFPAAAEPGSPCDSGWHPHDPRDEP